MIGLNYSSIHIDKKDNFRLSSIFTEDNLIYSLTRLIDNKIVILKEITGLKKNFFFDSDSLMSIFKKHNIFDFNIKEVSVAILNSDFTIVPDGYFKKNTKESILSNNSIKQYYKDYHVEKSKVSSINANCYFAFPITFKKFLNKHFKNVSIYHANTPLINSSENISSKNDFIIVNLNEYTLQTIVFKDRKFVQSNVYDIKTKDDILYYILLNLKNNAIPLNLAYLYLSGRVHKDSSIFQLLYEHIKNISFINTIPRTHFSNVFLGKPYHLFFDLYSLSLCE